MGKPPVRRENLFVGYLSKIRNAKLMQRMIRVTYQGYDLGDTSSLVNPQAAEEIRQAR